MSTSSLLCHFVAVLYALAAVVMAVTNHVDSAALLIICSVIWSNIGRMRSNNSR